MDHYECAVIGGGLTGLTTAFKLRSLGVHAIVIEKQDRIGGQIETHHSNGFVYESGPNTGAISHPEVAELFQSIDQYCKLEIANPSAKRRLILKHGVFHTLPNGIKEGITTPLFTWKDKFRILGEPFRKKGSNPNETVGELTLRRLGQSFLDYAVDPFISGIYSGDPMTLVTKYALPKLYTLEQTYGSFIKGGIAKAKEKKSERDKMATKEVFSAEGGLSNLVTSLAQLIGKSNIVVDAKDVVIHPEQGKWQIDFLCKDKAKSLTACHVVTTTAAYHLPKILPFVDKHLIEEIARLPYASLMQVSVGMKENPNPAFKAFGGLIPSKEKENVLGILYPYQCFKNRAPKGKALFSIFIGGIKHPELLLLKDDEIRELTTDILKRTMGYNEEYPIEHFAIFRHEKVIPQYDKDSKRRIECINKIETAYPGLLIGGNLKDGIGMADRIKQGISLAQRIAL